MSDVMDKSWQKLESCIHCGMCLPTCPTYRVTGSEAESPRGRLYLMKAFAQGRLESPQQLMEHLDPCLGCLACVTACPSGVQYDALLMTSREQLVAHQPWYKRKIRRFFLTKVLPNQSLLRFLAYGLRLYQRLGLQTLVRRLRLPLLAGPLGKLEQFTPSIQINSDFRPGEVFGQNRRGRVALFTGCIMDAAYAHVHRATVEVLVANGYEVVIPRQTCCGALAHHSGEHQIAESLAWQNVESILEAKPDVVLVNAAGCGSTLKDYKALLHYDLMAQAFCGIVLDVLEFLDREGLEGKRYSVPLKATYHAACHLHHAQKIQEEPYRLLRQIPDLTLVPLTEAEMCCGSAGVYNLAHPDLSLAILQEKMAHLEKTGADVVLAANPGCMLQLETGIRQSGLSMRVMHPIELLAMAYKPRSPHLHLVE